MRRLTRAPRPCQQGAASLVVVAVLLFVMLLTAAYASRTLIAEQKTSISQYRAAQAFEAADAGLQWTVAMLNAPKITDACRTDAANSSDIDFRARFLTANVASGVFLQAGTSNAQAGCRRRVDGGDERWVCDCTVRAGPLDVAQPDEGGLLQAFGVQVDRWPPAGPGAPAAMPATLAVTAFGCSGSLATCHRPAQQDLERNEGYIELSTHLGFLPALARTPGALVTARDAVHLGNATLANADAAGGFNVHAGAGVTLSAGSVLSGPPGSPPAATVKEQDTALAGPARALLVGLLGVDAASYRQLPSVGKVRCGGEECSQALQAALDKGWQLLWVEDDLRLGTALSIGQVDRPVLLVVNGNVRFEAPVAMRGALVVAAEGRSFATTAAANLRGVVVSVGGVSLDGGPQLTYDLAPLMPLRRIVGTFARVSGSWRDFN